MNLQRQILLGGMVIAFCSGNIHASEVLWNQAFVMQVTESVNPNALIYCMGQPYLMIDAERVGTGLELWARPACNTIGDNTFVKVDPGVLANESTVYGAGLYFAYAVSDYDAVDFDKMFDTHADYSIFIDVGESVFLAFGNQRYNPDNPYPTTYGWVELGLNENGDLVALSSAWDQDGNPLVVGLGATPEPSSGLLLLVGGALLALRRKEHGSRTRAVGVVPARSHSEPNQSMGRCQCKHVPDSAV